MHQPNSKHVQKKTIFNAEFAGPCQKEGKGCQTWFQVHWQKEKRQILIQEDLWKIFYDWWGASSIPYFNPDSYRFFPISSFRDWYCVSLMGSLQWAGTSSGFGRRRKLDAFWGIFLIYLLLVADGLRMGEQAELLCRVDFPLYAIASVGLFLLCHRLGQLYFQVSFVIVSLPLC